MIGKFRVSAFVGNQCGAIAPLFGLVLLVILGFVGLAVDGARWYSAKRQTSAAIDTGVLAAARILQLDPSRTSEALAAGKQHYLANVGSRHLVLSDTVDFALTDNNKAVAVTGSAAIQTVFLAVLGIDRLPLLTDAAAKAVFQATGLNEGSNIEISLMLDLTGSMCDDGQGPCLNSVKVQGLRDAATDLVNIVVQADQTNYSSRVAIVPFSTRVRVDVDNTDGVLMRKLTNLNPTWSGWFNYCLSGSGTNGGETAGTWSCQQYQPTLVTDWRIMPCVTERGYDAPSRINRDTNVDYTDDAPGIGRWLNAHGGGREIYFRDSSDTPVTTGEGLSAAMPTTMWNYRGPTSGGCGDVSEQNRIIPLTSDRQLLTSRIAQFNAGGSTAGALATAWSWYMLSPNWKTIWTGAAEPGPYSDLTAKQANGAPVLRKVAVLMTDGAFNTLRNIKNEDPLVVSNHAKNMCTAMKAQNIEIFTVGFALDQVPAAERGLADDVLRSCGTDLSHFYATLTVPELKAAFRDIAMKVSPVRLSQ
jgi:Flp pilus assembly protein TadG